MKNDVSVEAVYIYIYIDKLLKEYLEDISTRKICTFFDV